jgi:hypothetical protein
MTLRVPYEGFVAAVEQQLASRHVYIHAQAGRVLLTAAEAKHSVAIIATSRQSVEQVQKELHAAGFHVHEGLWSVDDDQEILALPYVAAVSYRATKERTGVWIEAYAEKPSEGEVIQKFFDEMSAEQNLADMSVGEFMVSAQVSISVLSPQDLEKYLESDNS